MWMSAMSVGSSAHSDRGLHPATPPDVICYYRDTMNRFVGVGACVSWAEIFKQLPHIESSWQRRKEMTDEAQEGDEVVGEDDLLAEVPEETWPSTVRLSAHGRT